MPRGSYSGVVIERLQQDVWIRTAQYLGVSLPHIIVDSGAEPSSRLGKRLRI